MMGDRSDPQARASIIAAACLALLALGAWAAGLTPVHPWGDDWAGYLMQARSIVDGGVDAELAMNTLAMQGSDVQIGPYAYPWGYPLLLAAAGLATGWSLVGLKSIGGFAVALLIVSTFALARMHLGLGLALWVAIAVGLQPGIIVEAGLLGSDVPFVALSAACLVLIFLQFKRAESGRGWSWALAAGVALISAAAFAIRSNGAVLPCTYAAMLGLVALRATRPWRETILHGLGFAAMMAALLGAYFAAFPDGSLVHAGYLSADPRVWVSRLVTHINAVATWLTLKPILGPVKLVPLAIMMALTVWGVARRPLESSILLVYLALHVALLTVFPFDGGFRYYHPLLPAAFLIMAFGCEGAWSYVQRFIALQRPATGARAAGAIALALIAAAMILQIRVDQARFADAGVEAPYAPATADVMAYVRTHAPQDARIAFFRPRAFRLLSGRLAHAINQPENLDRIDWYVFNGGTDDARTQIAESALRDSPGGFHVVHERPPYRIYVKDGHVLAGAPSPQRGLP